MGSTTACRTCCLLDPSLDSTVKPISHKAHDWMHASVVHGFWDTNMYLLMVAVIAAGVRSAPADLMAYVVLWIAPRRIGQNMKTLSHMFSRERWKSSSKAKYMKCSASEALTVYGIVACYVQAVWLRAGICDAACRAYLYCCEVLDLLLALPTGNIPWQDLETSVNKCLHECLAAGWKNYS